LNQMTDQYQWKPLHLVQRIGGILYLLTILDRCHAEHISYKALILQHVFAWEWWRFLCLLYFFLAIDLTESISIIQIQFFVYAAIERFLFYPCKLVRTIRSRYHNYERVWFGNVSLCNMSNFFLFPFPQEVFFVQ
jgi:hypothetical protein